jgi:hypothetical protein
MMTRCARVLLRSGCKREKRGPEELAKEVALSRQVLKNLRKESAKCQCEVRTSESKARQSLAGRRPGGAAFDERASSPSESSRSSSTSSPPACIAKTASNGQARKRKLGVDQEPIASVQAGLRDPGPHDHPACRDSSHRQKKQDRQSSAVVVNHRLTYTNRYEKTYRLPKEDQRVDWATDEEA